ncbi:MAG: hypothetical protein IJ727_00745, partial [Treponema sp.]|nr:hypothetical protein [Treponema sp.]
MDVEFCLHSCAKTDVKQGSGTKLNLCVRATASQIPYTHNLEFYMHGSCWKSVFVAANHSKLDIQAKLVLFFPKVAAGQAENNNVPHSTGCVSF